MSERPESEAIDGGRLRLLGATAWRHRLRAVLGGREIAWSARTLAGEGELFAAVTRDGLCRVRLGDTADVEAELAPAFPEGEGPPSVRHEDELLAPLLDRLAAWLEDPRAVELDLPVDAAGTAFQRRVWEAMTRIPSGEVRSYKEIAVELGRSSASRAVGGACGANPVPFVVPCHRVVGSDGRLTGFGLGLSLKQRLLAAEAGIRSLPL